jgi:hypothetical protein
LNKYFKLIIILLTTSPCFAQKSSISGIVKDSLQRPLQNASVLLYKTADSSPVKLSTTNDAGRFLMADVAEGRYQIEVTHTGFSKYRSPVIDLKQNGVHELDVVLHASSENLKAVTVTRGKQLIEKKADRTIVNVDAMVSSAGSDVLQLLENVPGVAVDNDGNISLNGRQGVQIVIDGKLIYLTGDALANYLRSLPSSQLDKIELMSSPPANYDASGNAGVIHIKTKRTGSKGFNGGLTLAMNQGKLFSTTNNLNINYRAGKINVYGVAGYVTQNRFTDLDIHRQYRNERGEAAYVFTQHSYIRRKNQAATLKAGIDYALNKKTTVGLGVSLLERPSAQRTVNSSRIVQPDGYTDSTTAANNKEDDRWRNRSMSLNFKKELNKEGNSLSADADYIVYRSGVNQFFTNTTVRQDGSTSFDRLKGDLPSDISILAFKTDYLYSIKKFNFETGIKSSYTVTDNMASFFVVNDNDLYPDYEKSNYFRYRENIHAAYASLQKTLKYFSLKAGVRVENTLSRGRQLGNAVKPDSSFIVRYTSLFPTLFLSYKLDSLAKHQINFSYGRRIERPFYQDLNPYVTPLDKFTLYVGNPFLKPAYANDFSLAYTLNHNIVTTASYSYTNNVIMESISLNGNNYMSRPGNLGRNKVLGLSMNASLKPLSWWSSTLYAEVQNRHYEGKLYNRYMDTAAVYFGTTISGQFQLGKNWLAELSGIYRTSVLVGQVSLASLWQMNAGIQKKVFDKKGTIKLAIRDIFYSGIRNGAIHYLNQAEANFRNQGDLRIATLSFTCNFGNTSQQGRSRSSGSAQTEQSRVREG